MKIIGTLLLGLLTTMGANATSYTDLLQATVGSENSEQQTTLLVEKSNGSYTISLKNFSASYNGTTYHVGNIVLNNVKGDTANTGDILMEADEDVTIQNGDDASVSLWVGPMLGSTNIHFIAKMNDSRIYALYSFNVSLLGDVQAQFGERYQLQNSGFENYHTEGSVQVPNGWHGYSSANASGVFALGSSLIQQNASTGDIRPGSTGSKSAQLTSTSISGAILNGLLTTGRLKASELSATSTQNCEYLDASDTTTDANGDPYYTPMAGTPDSMVMWVKYTQGSPSATYPYAGASAVITDGTYYQIPEDKSYTNTTAIAADLLIESNGSQWQRIATPFVKTGNDVKSKAVMVGLTTNTQGGEAGNDTLLIDDISLIYLNNLSTLNVNGNILHLTAGVNNYALNVDSIPTVDEVSAVTLANGALYTKKIDGDTLKVTAYADDLNSSTLYTVIFNVTEGVEETLANGGTKTLKALYDLDGKEVGNIREGKIYVAKYNEGSTQKIMTK